MSATMTRERAFEIRGADWIVRPWETTLTLPERDEATDNWGQRVPQEIMGLPCAVGWWTRPEFLRGVFVAFPNGWMIDISLLPGDPLNRVEAAACEYRVKPNGYLAWPLHDTPPDYDAMELLALIRDVAGRDAGAEG